MSSKKEERVKSRKYILYVGFITGWKKELEGYIEHQKLPWKIISLISNKNVRSAAPETDTYKQIAIDFDDAAQVQEVIASLGKNLIAVVNRGERNIPNFQKIIPYLPSNLLVPTVDALAKTTQKTKMRKAFWKYDKTITPKFEIISEVSRESIEKIIKKLEFPVIVKPAGLAQAVLVQSAYYPEELEKVLKTVFKKMKQSYVKMKGRGEPSVLVEEIIDGDQYSVEAFVDSIGNAYFCPFVKYTTSAQKGFDDFFSYEQTTPATISKESIHKAKEVSLKGIHALGLRNSTAHIELIRRDGDWYIVEIGPRIGGFRSMMYKKSYGINLDVLDINIHLGKTPKISRVKKGYTSVIKFFPNKEGVISKISGINKAKKLESYFEIHQQLKKGETALHAKNGGTYAFRITLFNTNKSQFIADKRRLEKMIFIETVKARRSS